MLRRYKFVEGPVVLSGSDGKFFITTHGVILSKEGEIVPFEKDEEGHRVVHVHGWDGERQYRIIDLITIQFKEISIEKENYNKVISFVINGDKDNTHASNIGYRFLGGKLEVKEYPGFYYIPGFTKYCVNEEGEIRNSKTFERRVLFKTKPGKKNSKGGYFVVTLMHGDKSYSFSRHRALGLVFMDYPDNVDNLVINHINGIPGDDRLDNLEWTTRGQNNIHACVNNLKDQQMAVLVRDVLTGVVTEYYSISECSRALGYSTDETIRARLYKSKFGQVFQEGTQVKLKSDERDWIIPEDPVQEIKNARQKKKVKVRDCATGIIKIYDSITEAEANLDLPVKGIGHILNFGITRPYYGIQMLFEDDGDFPPFTKEEYLQSLPKKLQARNLLTGEERVFSTFSECEKYIKTYVNQNVLKEGKQPVSEEGWQLKLGDSDWIEIPDVEEYIYKLQTTIMARNIANGIITIYDSAAHAGMCLIMDRKNIRKAAYTRGNKVYNGYQVRLGVSAEPWPNLETANNS